MRIRFAHEFAHEFAYGPNAKWWNVHGSLEGLGPNGP